MFQLVNQLLKLGDEIVASDQTSSSAPPELETQLTLLKTQWSAALTRAGGRRAQLETALASAAALDHGCDTLSQWLSDMRARVNGVVLSHVDAHSIDHYTLQHQVCLPQHCYGVVCI